MGFKDVAFRCLERFNGYRYNRSSDILILKVQSLMRTIPTHVRLFKYLVHFKYGIWVVIIIINIAALNNTHLF